MHNSENFVTENLEEEEETSQIVTHQPRTTSPNSGVLAGGLNIDDVWVKLAKCYTSAPDDEVVGFVTRGHGVSVHRQDCANARRLPEGQPERIVDIRWAEHSRTVPMTQVQVEDLDRGGLLSDVTRALIDSHVSTISGNTFTTRN